MLQHRGGRWRGRGWLRGRTAIMQQWGDVSLPDCSHCGTSAHNGLLLRRPFCSTDDWIQRCMFSRSCFASCQLACIVRVRSSQAEASRIE